MFNSLKPVEISGENRIFPVVLDRLLVGTYGLTHSHKKHTYSYAPVHTQLNQKLIPLLFSKFTSVNFRLYTLSTGPIVTTTYINTKEDKAGGR
jgi:hypothetical protein